MKTDYATIRIRVRTEEEEINTNELALSDALGEIANELEEWLHERARGTPLEFEEVQLI